MSNEKQRNRPASRQLQDKVGGLAPAGLSPDGNELGVGFPFGARDGIGLAQRY
jgi:hypothetical protein